MKFYSFLFSALVIGMFYQQANAQQAPIDIQVQLGDMTRLGADAYMVPEFRGEASFGGVGGAIARGGAEAGLNAYDEHIRRAGVIEFGQALVTESGGGMSRFLIHAVTVGSGAESEMNVVRQAMLNGLLAADQAGIRTVAAPTFGTGIIGQLTFQQSAQAMLAGVSDYVQQSTQRSVQKITIVIFGRGGEAEKVAQMYRNTARQIGMGSDVNTNETGRREFDPQRWANEMRGDAAANRDAGVGGYGNGEGALNLLQRLKSWAGFGSASGQKGEGTRVDPNAAAGRAKK